MQNLMNPAILTRPNNMGSVSNCTAICLMRSAPPSGIFGRSVRCGRHRPVLSRLNSARMVGSEHLGRCIHALMLVEESTHVTSKRPVFGLAGRSEEHTSELQSLMRISYAVFCLKKKKYK